VYGWSLLRKRFNELLKFSATITSHCVNVVKLKVTPGDTLCPNCKCNGVPMMNTSEKIWAKIPLHTTMINPAYYFMLEKLFGRKS